MEPLDMDAAYAAAAAFDAETHNRWVAEHYERFTKRTNYPKLGYLIHLLNEAGINSLIHGESFHAPLLYVEQDRIDEAWAILTPELDEMPDDSPDFLPYANEQPEQPELYEEQTRYWR